MAVVPLHLNPTVNSASGILQGFLGGVPLRQGRAAEGASSSGAAPRSAREESATLVRNQGRGRSAGSLGNTRRHRVARRAPP